MKIKTIIISSILSCSFLATSLLGFSQLLKQDTSSTIYQNWMAKLDDNTTLRDINMPGSHDTMALYSVADLSGQCQSLELKAQLNLGVRFLDIRLKNDNDKLKAVHGFIDQKCSFDQITSTLETFIKDNPSEFIIMSIKEEADPSNNQLSFEETLKTYLDSDIYLTNNEIPNKLGDVRGKVMLLSRYKDSTIGVPAYEGWLDSTSFTMNNDIYVQDTYQIKSKEEKQEEIIKCFNESGHALKINFLSAYRTDTFPPSYSISVAKDINPWINKEIGNYSNRNIVLYDFINEENMKCFFQGGN